MLRLLAVYFLIINIHALSHPTDINMEMCAAHPYTVANDILEIFNLYQNTETRNVNV